MKLLKVEVLKVEVLQGRIQDLAQGGAYCPTYFECCIFSLKVT